MQGTPRAGCTPSTQRALCASDALARKAWQILSLGESRKLHRQVGGKIELQLDQATAHEGAKIVAPHELLKRRVLVFERLPRTFRASVRQTLSVRSAMDFGMAA